jgi:hypothetical protein
MPLSPRTQQMQAGLDAGPEQETHLFEQGFSDQAYALLSSRMPDVLGDVVTFKVLKTDIDKGSGLGAFIVMRGPQPLYIPVILADNALKPIDIIYSKAQNIFLPLTKGWLDEIDKATVSSLGEGVKTPETLYTDVDIRNVVVPPWTGRFSYASAYLDIEQVLGKENLEKVAASAEFALPALLSKAPNNVKRAFQAFLQKNPATLKQAAAVYGVSVLQKALEPGLEKFAAKQNWGGGLWIADKDNTPTDFKRIFGDQAAEAYAGVKRKGFAAKDTRFNHNSAMLEQPLEQWTEPTQPGVYRLYSSDGKEDVALVLYNPTDVFSDGTRYSRRPVVRGHDPLVDNSYYDPTPHGTQNRVYPMGRPNESEYVTQRAWDAKPFLAVFGDGNYLQCDKLVGRPSYGDDLVGEVYKKLFKDVAGEPKAGKGFFVRYTRNTYQATVPMEIKSVSTGSDGVRRIKATKPMGFGERTLVTDATNPYSAIWMPKGADVVYMPPDFVWVPLKERLNENSWFKSALDLQNCVTANLLSTGAKKVSIKDAGANQFSVDRSPPMSKVAALRKVATDYVLKVDDAWALLEKAASEGHARAYVASVQQMARAQMMFKGAADDDKKKSDSSKRSGPPKKAPAGGGADAGGGDPGMDDAGMGQQAAMAAMAPPPPPAPSPVELAAMEMDQAIQQEMQKLMERQQTVQAIVARSHEIAGGAPPSAMTQTQAMGAPPSSMNLATGGPGMQPGPTSMMPGSPGAMTPGMQGDPSQMDMGPSQMGAVDPSQMGGALPPMGAGDPSQMGMGGDPSQMGMDPSMGQMPGSQPGMGQPQPPHAMMPPEGPNAVDLPQEVNPQFLNQAAQLHSADMFDAAAVAALAQSPALHGVVAQVLPNLEKSIDNLARVRLTLWTQEAALKPQVGEQTYTELDDSMTQVFKGIGDLVLRLTRGVQAVRGPEGGLEN